jgi:hypothetical protein
MTRLGLRWGWFYGLLVVAVLALYAPTARFGLIWDDPKWYEQGAGRAFWQFFLPLPTYQFYRPLSLWLNQQFVSPAGVVNAPLAHALQIGAHLLAALLAAPALRALGLGEWHARLAALLFAVYPFSYQAVAWQQALQAPLAMLWVLCAVLAAHAFRRRGRAAWLGLSLAAYAAALLFQESALPFVCLFLWMAAPDLLKAPRDWRNGWPGLHLLAAAVYVWVWLSVPRQGGVTGAGFQPIVLAYGLQAAAFPVARPLAVWGAAWSVNTLHGVFGAVVALLLVGVWRGQSARAAALTGLWIAAGSLPVWAGLSWGYVEVGERLLYPASLGVAALWAGAAAWALAAGPGRRRALGGLLLVGVLGLSLQHWSRMHTLYRIGTQHLARTVKTLAATPEARVLLVNFPDRIEIRPPLYPLGFWGLTLAPVVQNVSDFALAAEGRSAEDRSLSAFLTGAAERDEWPYRVDMRGVNSDPAALFEAARWADRVYLTDYLPDGTLRLREVGDVRPGAASRPVLATLGDAVRLAEAEIGEVEAHSLTLRLVWECLQPLQLGDTIFVHIWKDGVYEGGADGDSLGELIPLYAWEAGTEVVDLRRIDLTSFEPGQHEVRVGIYNRDGGARYPALSAAGVRFADDEIVIGMVSLP